MHKKIWQRRWSATLLALVLGGCAGLISLNIPTEEQRSGGEWLMLGKNDHHQHFSGSNVTPPLNIVWKKRVKSVVVDHPLAVGDYIIAPTKAGELYLLDYATGAGIGSSKIGPAMEHVPSISLNTMVIGMKAGKTSLFGLDLRNASKEFESEVFPEISTSPLIVADRIFFGSERKRFFCASRVDGSKLWEFKTTAAVYSSPAHSEGRIVFADIAGNIYALNATEGTVLWQTSLQGNIQSHVVLGDSLAYIGTTSGNFYALDIGSGAIRWEQQYAGSIYSSPSLYGNMLYFGHNGHDVIALHKRSGEEIWRYQTAGIVNTVPLPSPDYLYVTSWDKKLHVLNRFSGQLIFSYELDKPVKSSPIIYRDYLILHLANDQLIALANEKLILNPREKK